MNMNKRQFEFEISGGALTNLFIETKSLLDAVPVAVLPATVDGTLKLC